MANIVPIPALVQLPTPPSTNDPTNFTPRADAFLGALPGVQQNIHAIGEAARTNAQVATEKADSAGTSATAAQSAREGAEAAAALAANAPSTHGSSGGSLTIGTGSKTLYVQAGRAFVPGQYVSIARTVEPVAQRMMGFVVAYDAASGQLTVDVSVAAGSGTHSGWTVGIAAPPAPASLPVHRVTANATAIAGLHYSLAAPGITLQMPAAPVAGDCIAFTNASAQPVYVNWGGRTVKGIAPQPQAMLLPTTGHAAVVFDGQTWLPMPGAQG